MRYLVVHAHLYQPPRENPWTEVVERQPSAAPFHDWNERVSDECYERLGAAGVHGPDGRIVSLVNLYGRCSFNVGPTLAAWLDQHRPEAIRDAAAGHRAAIERTGHGSALMQAYGHAILPLCEPRERRLQIAWGKSDFAYRFGTAPEGIWLSECAVDTATLESCADAGLRFTVVAPEQVVRIRALDGGAWHDVTGNRVPPHRPYVVKLPSGRTMTVFVFDGPLSRGAAFGGKLSSGQALLDSFRAALDGVPPHDDGLVLLAADGETFGHHQKGAENALAEALVRARLGGLAHVTHLGDLYHRLPATWEATLGEPSAWSCVHGVGRWERDCGCAAGGHPHGWSWSWRQVLRHAVSMLRDRVFSLIDRRAGTLFRDPWAAAEAYGDVIVRSRSIERIDDLLARHAVPGLLASERVRATSLLELIRQTLFAATSCGWFFDDIAGLEAVQVMRHAARAAELTREVFGIDLEPDLLNALSVARANEPRAGNGAEIYRREALTARRLPCEAAAAHAVGRMREALTTTQSPSAVSTSFGAYAVDDTAPPEFEYDATGEVVVRGEALVQHLRTGVTQRHLFSVKSDGPGRRTLLEIDGRPVAQPSPAVREALLHASTDRAARLLPAPKEDTLVQLAWIGREARELGTPLASPFPEALRGAGRALVQELLTRPARSPQVGVRALAEALGAAHSAGLTRQELADLRPALDRHLAFYTNWILTADLPGAIPDLVRAIEVTREAAGDAVLSRVRRWLVDRYEAIASRPVLQKLLDAAGLAPDALVPLDTPVRPVVADIAG